MLYLAKCAVHEGVTSAIAKRTQRLTLQPIANVTHNAFAGHMTGSDVTCGIIIAPSVVLLTRIYVK